MTPAAPPGVPYQATGKSRLMDLCDRPAPFRDPLLAALLEEVACVGEERLSSSRLGLRLSPAELAGFRDRVHGFLDEFARRPADPDGEKWSVYIGMHLEA